MFHSFCGVTQANFQCYPSCHRIEVDDWVPRYLGLDMTCVRLVIVLSPSPSRWCIRVRTADDPNIPSRPTSIPPTVRNYARSIDVYAHPSNLNIHTIYLRPQSIPAGGCLSVHFLWFTMGPARSAHQTLISVDESLTRDHSSAHTDSTVQR